MSALSVRKVLKLGAIVSLIVYGIIFAVSNAMDRPLSRTFRTPLAAPTDNIDAHSDIRRFCTFLQPQGGSPQVGIAVDLKGETRVLPLQKAHVAMTGHKNGQFSDMIKLVNRLDENMVIVDKIVSWHAGNNNSVDTYAEEDITYLPPIANPPKLVDTGTPGGHSRNMKRAFLKDMIPIWFYRSFSVPLNWILGDAVFSSGDAFHYFVGNNLGIYGSGNDVVLPDEMEEIDIEAEIGIVIAKEGKDIPVEKAADHIAGFILCNDFTMRDIQKNELRAVFGFQKSKVINSAGPYLVTGIKLEDIRIHVLRNGEPVLTPNMQDLRWSAPEIVSKIASFGESVACGQIITTGALTAGTFFELELAQAKPGDVIEIIGNQGLGILRNRIIRPKEGLVEKLNFFLPEEHLCSEDTASSR